MTQATKTVSITMAQALVRHLAGLWIDLGDGKRTPYCGGVWAIFGHGNVAGIGEALAEQKLNRVAESPPLRTLRGHNEQSIAHAATAFAKASFRRRFMAVTTSIGPGATNLVTAAAVAHVNRLPLLLLPGDIFASRAPDPVLQQLEDFHGGDISVNDCFRPVSRYFDRIMRPEQILTALPHAIATMLDPAACGPTTLALPQDVQTEAFNCPISFLQPRQVFIPRPQPDAAELAATIRMLNHSKKPLIIAGGGALYSDQGESLRQFAAAFSIPVAETQAGKSAVPWDGALSLGAIGVTGSPAANQAAAACDCIIAVGTRLQDFTTASHSLFGGKPLIQINTQRFDAVKCHAQPLVADAAEALAGLTVGLNQSDWRIDPAWLEANQTRAKAWQIRIEDLTSGNLPPNSLPYEADVIGAVRRSATVSGAVSGTVAGQDSDSHDIAICAAGTLPAELHKLWRTRRAGGYHMEYGYSCMGYEIAGGLGVKLAQPNAEVIVMVGDGSYLMANSEIATSIMLGLKIIIVVLDNRGFGCISRLQQATGQARFNNMLEDCVSDSGVPVQIDFAAHAASLGAVASYAENIDQLSLLLTAARRSDQTHVVVINTTAERTTADGGAWWEVAIPEISLQPKVATARSTYLAAKKNQFLG